MDSDPLNSYNSFENNDEQFCRDDDFEMLCNDIFSNNSKKDFSFSSYNNFFLRDDSTKDITCKYSGSTFDNFIQLLKNIFMREFMQKLREPKKKKKKKNMLKKILNKKKNLEEKK